MTPREVMVSDYGLITVGIDKAGYIELAGPGLNWRNLQLTADESKRLRKALKKAEQVPA